MKCFWCAFVLALVCAFVIRTAPAQMTRSDPAANASPSLDEIVKNLASPDVAQRETAEQYLEKIPADQYDTLNQIAGMQANADVERLLHARTHEMVWDLAQTQPSVPLPTAAHITGRLVDEAGAPIVGASARAILPVCREPPQIVETVKTDAQGRFDLSVPFLDVNYAVLLEIPGWDSARIKAILVKQDTEAGDFVLKKRPAQSIHGSVMDDAGRPVAVRDVQIVGAYGITRSAPTDAQGHFTIDGLPSYIGQAVVHSGTQTTPLKITRAGDITLNLVEAGSLSGNVVGDKGQPLPGAIVLAQPAFDSGFQLQGTTTANGAYTIPDVPPGQWRVSAVSPAFSHRPPQEMFAKLPQITLKPGETATADIAMERKAIVYGRVIDSAGRPVGGAMVGTKDTWARMDIDAWRMVQTDAQGRFIIGTGQTARPGSTPANHLVVFSPRDGLAVVPLGDLSPGDVRELTVKLAGSMHVAGRVVDPSGRPIQGVSGGTVAQTDADGRFDLGLVPRPASGHAELLLLAPRPPVNVLEIRPDGTRAITTGEPEIADRAHAPTFYANQRIPLPAAGDAPDMKITLQPAQLLEFTGIVRDARGDPAAGAEVYLLAGNITKDSWFRMVQPYSAGVVDTFAVNVATTGPDGRYTLWSVREEGDTVLVAGATHFDFAHLALGVYAGGKEKLTEKIAVPESGKVETNIQLDNPQMDGP